MDNPKRQKDEEMLQTFFYVKSECTYELIDASLQKKVTYQCGFEMVRGITARTSNIASSSAIST